MVRNPGSSKNTRSDTRRTARAIPRNSFGYQLEQHQGTAVDSLLRMIEEPLGSLFTWAVIGIAIALPLTLFLVLQNLQRLGQELDEISTVSVYLNKDVSDESLRELAGKLSMRADIVAVNAMTSTQALAEFETGSGFGQVLAGLDANPLPGVLVLTPASLDTNQLLTLQRELQQEPDVNEIVLDLAWLQRLQAIAGLAARLALLLGAMLAMGVLLVIGNTIRLAIENRRAEIVVIKLVGGTDAYVARPFLYTGLWYGAGGGLLAVMLSSLSIWLLSGPYARLLGSYDADVSLQGPGVTGAFLVLVMAAVLGWFGALISVLRHLRAIQPR